MSSYVKAGFSEGTGYGGVDGTDKKKLLEGRKKAAKEETQHDKESLQYLKTIHQKLAMINGESSFSVGGEDSTKLVKLLQELFRNQVPADWTPRCALYLMAFDVCDRLAACGSLGTLLIHVVDDEEASGSAKIEIEETDDETILSSLSQLASLAECFVSSSAKPTAAERKFAARVVEVQKKVERTATRVKAETKKNAPILSVMTQQDIYKKELGPLRFDLCPSLSDHYLTKGKVAGSTPATRARTLFKELTSYKTALPVEYGSSIFVRAVEDRLDTIRALILGPDETPYANGCFVFDITLPPGYPKVAPKVHFANHGGQRFNPNLYNCGKVCLSLLGTWRGPGWISGESTLLQVLISIQSLILVPDPYFNEPGYESSRGTSSGTSRSNGYNQNIQRHTLRISLAPILACLAEGKPSPYPEFDDVFRKHFLHKRLPIERQLTDWARKNAAAHCAAETVRGHLQTFAAAQKPLAAAKRKRVPTYNVNANCVIDLANGWGSSKRPASVPWPATAGGIAKPSSPNEVVSLLDEAEAGQEDSKMPAVVTNSNSLASGGGSDVVDLT